MVLPLSNSDEGLYQPDDARFTRYVLKIHRFLFESFFEKGFNLAYSPSRNQSIQLYFEMLKIHIIIHSSSF